MTAFLVGVVLTGCGTGDRKAGAGWLTCDGFTNPTNTFRTRALKHRPGAERLDLAPNRVLRRHLEGSIARSQGFDRPGWIELESSPRLVKFGLPSKPWGLIAQADVERDVDKWSVSMKPCRLQHSTPDRVILTLSKPAEGFGDPKARSIRVLTSHDLDACRPLRPDIAVRESSSRVTLTATYPWDAKSQSIPGSDQDPCGGTGNTRTYTVDLTEPLGSRAVRQGGFVPVRLLESRESGSFAAGPPAFPITLD